MKFSKSFAFVTCLLFTTASFAAIPQNKNMSDREQKLLETLTGKKVSTSVAKTPAQKALVLARQSSESKNYIQAIKRYNFILKNFPKTAEAAEAYKDKAQIYSRLGLKEPAQYNLKKSQAVSGMVQKNKTVK